MLQRDCRNQIEREYLFVWAEVVAAEQSKTASLKTLQIDFKSSNQLCRHLKLNLNFALD